MKSYSLTCEGVGGGGGDGGGLTCCGDFSIHVAGKIPGTFTVEFFSETMEQWMLVTEKIPKD